MNTRSKTKLQLEAAATRQPENPQAQEEPQEDSSISVNWFFFDKSNVYNDDLLIKVPRSLFNDASQQCCSLFATELLKAFKYTADERSIMFWTPKENTTQLEWKKGIDLEQSFEPIDLSRSFAEALAGRIDDEDAVHLVVSDSSIPVNWLFFDKLNVYNINRLIKVPRSLFNDASQQCCSLFATELLKAFKYTADERSIMFWTPKEKTTRLKWKEGIDLEQSFEPIDLSRSFAEALAGRIDDEDALHLVVSDSSIPVNWFFFDKSNVYNIERLIKVPRSLFNDASQQCCSLFATELLKAFKYTADERSIMFWTPKEKTTWLKWKKGIDLEQSFEPIDLSQSFAKALAGQIDDEDAVHLVVTAEVSVHEQDEPDMVPELKEFKRYQQTLLANGLTGGYQKTQNEEATAIYDGRRAPNGISTTSPPIEIYHPVFSQFIHILNDPNVQPTVDDLKKVQDLMVCQLFSKEDDYALGLLLRLSEILQFNICYNADGTVTLFMGEAQIVYLVLELKRAHQGSLNSRRSWIDSSKKPIREKCCCPTFLVAGAGPWITVSGEVFTDRFIVQRLTDMWMSLSSSEEDSRVYHNTRVLIALRRCLAELQRYYQGLANIPRLVANKPHPRCFPYPNSFTAADGSVTRFQYLCSLEDDSKCVTYLAELIGNSKVVVKFVARYGKEVHKFLAQHGYAPKLLYCGPIPGNPLSGILSEPARQAPPGLCLRADVMHMVVMEYVNARSEKPQDRCRSQIEKILRLLHTNGYVFGDLREPNVLYGPDGIVKMIDFDWCGRYDLNVPDEHLPPTLQEDIDRNKEEIENKDRVGGDVSYVYYPLSMSKLEGMWAPGMEPLAPIRPQHDWAMLDKLLPKATYSH